MMATPTWSLVILLWSFSVEYTIWRDGTFNGSLMHGRQRYAMTTTLYVHTMEYLCYFRENEVS